MAFCLIAADIIFTLGPFYIWPLPGSAQRELSDGGSGGTQRAATERFRLF